ncbi:hypothetical protein ACIRD2_03345 [Streptomyces sp. NPDC093595]|uniref:hypothetical protein n=1 Tax=Streptomyces sp. NPDC093595 TaxID=3366045 RepID=UPI00381DE64E
MSADNQAVQVLSLAGAMCGVCGDEPGDRSCKDCETCRERYVAALRAAGWAPRAEVLAAAADDLHDVWRRTENAQLAGGIALAMHRIRDLAMTASQGSTAGDEGAETEAHPRSIRWRVEIYDPLAKEWAPGTPFLVRERAVERLNMAQIDSPRWAHNETPVARRLVRETTTYTIEAGESR